MRKDFEKLFNHLEPPAPPAGLLDKIIVRIREEERLLFIKRRFVLFLISVVLSAGAFVSAVKIFWQELVESGFYQYLFLALSDFGSILENWQNFGFALLESLPAASIISVLAIILIFLWSLRNFIIIIQSLNLSVDAQKKYGLK